MPPKKKGGKKGKSSGIPSEAASASARETTAKPADASPDILTELDREFYLIQIRDLESKLNR